MYLEEVIQIYFQLKETFKPITFDRKQRIAFLAILLLILIGGIWNIWGISYDRNKVIETVDLETAIVEQRNYKRYWRSQRKKYNWNNYKSNKKYSRSNNAYNKSSDKNYSSSDKKYSYQSDIQKENLNTAKNIFPKSKYQDSIVNVEVDENYTEDSKVADLARSIQYELHYFDPNTVSKEELQSMFLPEKWVNNLINYRNKGGTFRNKAEIKKLYSTTDDLYVQIEPYVNINEEDMSAAIAKSYEEKNKEWLEELKREGEGIDLSQANAETLRKLPNISTGVANGIVKYRQLLGGYHSMSQLSEVYYITPEGLESLKAYGTLNPVINYININKASLDRLGKHPYITYKRAKVIQKYIKNHGPFAEVDDVMKIGVWSQEQFDQVKPYFMVEDKE